MCLLFCLCLMLLVYYILSCKTTWNTNVFKRWSTQIKLTCLAFSLSPSLYHHFRSFLVPSKKKSPQIKGGIFFVCLVNGQRKLEAEDISPQSAPTSHHPSPPPWKPTLCYSPLSAHGRVVQVLRCYWTYQSLRNFLFCFFNLNFKDRISFPNAGEAWPTPGSSCWVSSCPWSGSWGWSSGPSCLSGRCLPTSGITSSQPWPCTRGCGCPAPSTAPGSCNAKSTTPSCSSTVRRFVKFMQSWEDTKPQVGVFQINSSRKKKLIFFNIATNIFYF